MTYERFLDRVKEEIIPLLPDDIEHVSIYPVTKNNGIIFDGLVMQSRSLNISPTIYMNPYYNQYILGRPFESVLSDIADTYLKNRPKTDFDISQFKDWEKVKSNVVRKLVNYEQNKEMLEVMPHKRIEDLAIVYQVTTNDDAVGDEYATIAVYDQHLRYWGVSLDEMDEVAEKNTNRLLPFSFQSITELLRNFVGGAPMPHMSEVPMYYLGNRLKMHGAVQVLNTQLMDSIKDILGEEYYVIPSSIHEVLLMPRDDDFEYDEIESMIQEVNETELDSASFLSDKAYVVDAVNHKLVLAERYEDYKRELKLREQLEKEKEKKPEEPKGPKM